MSLSPQKVKPTKAVIYCRVSGAKQVREGHGLESQEARCREFANYKGYDVVEVFNDDVTGKRDSRPAMSKMLSFLRLHKRNTIVVIIDDISRLARGVKAHISLREDLTSVGGILESPSLEFGEGSDSKLVEHMLASVAEHQREKNAEQTKNRMRGRVLNGYWVFQAPIGYKYQSVKGQGKMIVRNEPYASIIQEGLEGYASGRFETQAELKRFFESQPAFPKDLPNGQIRQQKVSDILNRPVYAGYIENLDWKISLRKGQHDGIISLKTYEKIQKRRTSVVKAATRSDINVDFPLRGFVLCADCGKPHTACWSKSSTGVKHPYYLCKTAGCASARKSIRRDVMEAEFKTALGALKPTQGLFDLVKAMFKDAWDQRQAQANDALAYLKIEKRKIDKKIESLLDRIVETSNDSVVSAYEKRIEKLELEKMVLDENLTNNAKPKHSFTEMFELSFEFLSNPSKLWDTGNLALRRIVLKLAFAERITYSRKTGLRTPVLSLPFKMLGGLESDKREMVPVRGLELLTY